MAHRQRVWELVPTVVLASDQSPNSELTSRELVRVITTTWVVVSSCHSIAVRLRSDWSLLDLGNLSVKTDLREKKEELVVWASNPWLCSGLWRHCAIWYRPFVRWSSLNLVNLRSIRNFNQPKCLIKTRKHYKPSSDFTTLLLLRTNET